MIGKRRSIQLSYEGGGVTPAAFTLDGARTHDLRLKRANSLVWNKSPFSLYAPSQPFKSCTYKYIKFQASCYSIWSHLSFNARQAVLLSRLGHD